MGKGTDAHRAALSELLALYDVVMKAGGESNIDQVKALGVIILVRIRQLHRRLAPLHSYTDHEIEDIVAFVEKHSDIQNDPKLQGKDDLARKAAGRRRKEA